MKKQILAAFIAVMTIILLTGCGSPKQLSKSVTVELGNKKGINVTDVIDISEDKAEDAKIDDKKVDYGKKGKYDATITYDKKEYKIIVKIKDTVAPEATAKENITVQTGTAVHVTDCLDKITEASNNVEAKFESKPKQESVANTEAVETTESNEPSEAASVGNDTDKSYPSSELNDVKIKADDEITYTKAGDYDNNIVITDGAGNETKVPVKISVINPPAINGVTDKTVTVGDTIDYMAGVTATDGKGQDITGSVQVDSSAVNTGAVGAYQIKYTVTDSYGFSSEAVCNVTVNEPLKEEPKQEVADNSESDKKNDNNKNSVNSSKKHNSSNNNTSSDNGGQSSSNGGGSNNSQPANNGGGSSSGGSSNSGSSSSNITPVNRADVPAGWKLVDVGDAGYVAVNPNAGKYDTTYAGNARWGLWANGEKYNLTDVDNASMGANREAALYFVAAGMMDKAFFNDVYGQ